MQLHTGAVGLWLHHNPELQWGEQPDQPHSSAQPLEHKLLRQGRGILTSILCQLKMASLVRYLQWSPGIVALIPELHLQ